MSKSKLFLFILALLFLTTGCSLKSSSQTSVTTTPPTQNVATNNLSSEEIKNKTADFINNYLMENGEKVQITNAVEENGLYKINVVLANGNSVNSYVTLDGQMFFPNAISFADVIKQKTAEKQTKASTPTDLPKSEKPVVELFVMSHCPYGLQIEKGMIPVVQTLGNKMDFSLKFVDYAMHQKPELDEEMNQYCIMTEQKDKYLPYLTCFLTAGESENCLKQTGINTKTLSSCVSKVDTQYQITETFNDKSKWGGEYPPFPLYKTENEKYNVGGSPTLVVNGKQIQSNRDANSLLQTICAAFDKEPAECQTPLPSDSPQPGFGTSTAPASPSENPSAPANNGAACGNK